MGAYIVRRVLVNVLVFLLITIAIFWLVHLAPGNPIALQIPPSELNAGSAAYIARLSHQLGLDQPIPVQYWDWLVRALHGNLGYSISNDAPVSTLIGQRIGPTLELMVTGLILSLLIAIPLGIVAATRRNSWLDYGSAGISLGSVSIPTFFIALIAIYLVTVKFPLLPSSGMSNPAAPSVPDAIRHLILPGLILGFGNSGMYMRYVRASMIEELNTDYVRTAEAKGASPLRVVLRHSFRNSLIPLVTVVVANLPQLLAGAVVIEQVFAWPGMGQLALSAVQADDYSVIIAFALIIAILVLVCNLMADLLYAVIDPRIRLQ